MGQVIGAGQRASEIAVQIDGAWLNRSGYPCFSSMSWARYREGPPPILESGPTYCAASLYSMAWVFPMCGEFVPREVQWKQRLSAGLPSSEFRFLRRIAILRKLEDPLWR